MIDDYLKDDKTFDHAHDLWTLFENAPKEEVDAVISLMALIAYSKNPESVFSYYAGIADQIYKQRFDICPTCKVEHEAGDRTAYDDYLKSRMNKLAKDFLGGVADLDVPEANSGGQYPVQGGNYI